jgi:hypothetical protein
MIYKIQYKNTEGTWDIGLVETPEGSSRDQRDIRYHWQEWRRITPEGRRIEDFIDYLTDQHDDFYHHGPDAVVVLE